MEQKHRSHIKQVFIIFFVLLILGNLFFLDYLLFSPNSFFLKETLEFNESDKKTNTTVADQCGESCKREIVKEIEKVKIKTQTQVTTQKETTTPVKAPKTDTALKDDYVVFGSGTRASTDWTDVPGLQAYADSKAYGEIKEVIFEASIQIPTGNEVAYARLYNATDQHPVWYSEVSVEGGEAKFLQSKPISLDEGKKLYKVQMKTSLSFSANLIQSRIHIAHY